MAGLSRPHKKQAFRPVGVVKIDFSMIQVETPQKPLTIQDAITMKQAIDRILGQIWPNFNSKARLGSLSEASGAVAAEKKQAFGCIGVVNFRLCIKITQKELFFSKIEAWNHCNAMLMVFAGKTRVFAVN